MEAVAGEAAEAAFAVAAAGGGRLDGGSENWQQNFESDATEGERGEERERERRRIRKGKKEKGIKSDEGGKRKEVRERETEGERERK